MARFVDGMKNFKNVLKLMLDRHCKNGLHSLKYHLQLQLCRTLRDLVTCKTGIECCLKDYICTPVLYFADQHSCRISDIIENVEVMEATEEQRMKINH